MKKLTDRVFRRFEKGSEELIQVCLREGLLELVGFDHGEPIYRTTEKGLRFLEKIKKEHG